MQKGTLLILLCVTLSVFAADAATYATTPSSPIVGSSYVSGPTLGAKNAAVLLIDVDNTYTLSWNGETINCGSKCDQVKNYTLVPVPECGHKNVLAIDAVDYGGLAGIIMQVGYCEELYQMGASPEIKLARPNNVSDHSWRTDPWTDPNMWVPSDRLSPCPEYDDSPVADSYFLPGSEWRWYKHCTDVMTRTYVKLVIETCCQSKSSGRRRHRYHYHHEDHSDDDDEDED